MRIADCGFKSTVHRIFQSEIRNLFFSGTPDFTAIPDEIRQDDD